MRNEWEYDELEDFIAEHTDDTAAALCAAAQPLCRHNSTFATPWCGALARISLPSEIALPSSSLGLNGNKELNDTSVFSTIPTGSASLRRCCIGIASCFRFRLMELNPNKY